MSQYLDYSFVYYLNFWVSAGNKTYNAQCEQFKKIERIAKLIPDRS